MEIFREFTFEAAHRLPNVPAGHKCARLHGHSYRVEVHVAGPVGAATGWVMDFGDMADACASAPRPARPLLPQRDPRPGEPDQRVLARWIWDRLAPVLSGTGAALSAVVVRETCTSGCVYRGD